MIAASLREGGGGDDVVDMLLGKGADVNAKSRGFFLSFSLTTLYYGR